MLKVDSTIVRSMSLNLGNGHDETLKKGAYTYALPPQQILLWT